MQRRIFEGVYFRLNKSGRLLYPAIVITVIFRFTGLLGEADKSGDVWRVFDLIHGIWGTITVHGKRRDTLNRHMVNREMTVICINNIIEYVLYCRYIQSYQPRFYAYLFFYSLFGPKIVRLCQIRFNICQIRFNIWAGQGASRPKISSLDIFIQFMESNY